MKKIKKIGVAGVGMVGSQVEKWFSSKKTKVAVFDKFKKIGKKEDLFDADLIFVCFPTPHQNSSENGIDMFDFEDFIKDFPKGRIFVIKSTVPIGTTNHLQEKFPQHYFLHNPEFLTESTAWADFALPVFQLIGYTKKSKKYAKQVLSLLPKSKHSQIGSSEETELFKFARNTFLAIKVAFANHIYDICEAAGLKYDNLKKIIKLDPWIGQNHLEVLHKNYRGFGGKCFPKDLRTFIKTFKKFGIKEEIFSATDSYNTKLLSKQGLGKTLEKFWLENRDSN